MLSPRSSGNLDFWSSRNFRMENTRALWSAILLKTSWIIQFNSLRPSFSLVSCLWLVDFYLRTGKFICSSLNIDKEIDLVMNIHLVVWGFLLWWPLCSCAMGREALRSVKAPYHMWLILGCEPTSWRVILLDFCANHRYSGSRGSPPHTWLTTVNWWFMQAAGPCPSPIRPAACTAPGYWINISESVILPLHYSSLVNVTDSVCYKNIYVQILNGNTERSLS